MRLARLDLDRYGRFTDVHLSLPHGESDFHVIYGPNEAGKSTTRNALAESLVGSAWRPAPNSFKTQQGTPPHAKLQQDQDRT